MSNERNYEVGYGKPPVHSRFKPGQSGNPKGRKPGSKNVMTLLEQILFETVKVRENGKIRRMPAIRACLLSLRNQALKGEPKARDQMLKLATLYHGAQSQGTNTTTPEGVDGATDLALMRELQRMLRDDQANGISFASDADDGDPNRTEEDST